MEDKVKCIDCKFCVYEGASMDYPYPTVFCSKGEWEGAEKNEDLEIELECKLFYIRD